MYSRSLLSFNPLEVIVAGISSSLNSAKPFLTRFFLSSLVTVLKNFPSGRFSDNSEVPLFMKNLFVLNQEY